jgi:hypothetical protein
VSESERINDYGDPIPEIPGFEEGKIVLGTELAGARGTVYWLGQLANSIDDYLERVPRPTAQTPGWDKLDAVGREAFAVDIDHVLRIDHAIHSSLAWGGFYTHVLPRQSEARLRSDTNDYRYSLPFTTDELNVMEGVYHGYQESGPVTKTEGPCLPAVTRLRAERFGSSGRPGGSGQHGTVRSGAELTDRWWDWRRGVGEFTVQSSHERAMRELSELRSYLGGRWADGDWEERLEVD